MALHHLANLILRHESSIIFQETAPFTSEMITLYRGEKTSRGENPFHTIEAGTMTGGEMLVDMIADEAGVQGAKIGTGH